MADKPSSRSPAANDENSELNLLKGLLIGEEQSSIHRLESAFNDPEKQQAFVSHALSASLRSVYRESPEQLVAALDRPVANCVSSSVKRDPGFFADILYPVMGPAIRRSIAEAMRGLVQQINQTLEHSLTLKGLKWRFEAARTGLPFGEIVLRHTLRYRVEEVFLIQNGSGLLIQHVGQGDSELGDADAVSAMLTAIRDFASDTLDRDEHGAARLQTIDTGAHTLWLMHGPKAYLACAIRGVAPVALRDDLNRVGEQLHGVHGRLLEDFDGDTDQAAEVRPLLTQCLRAESSEPARRNFPWPIALLASVMLAGSAWWLSTIWQENRRQAERTTALVAAVNHLADAPGIIVAGWELADDQLRVTGLQDPLAPPASAVLENAGLDSSDFRLKMHSFESTDRTTALARARQRLAPPATIELALGSNGILRAAGVAAPDWLTRADLLATTVPGVTGFDASGFISTDQNLLATLTMRLQPPASIQLDVDAAVLIISGTAPLAWVGQIDQAIGGLPELAGIDRSRLQIDEAVRFETLRQTIERTEVVFVTGTQLAPPQQASLESLAVLLEEARDLGAKLQKTFTLQIIGRTDGTGSPEQNLYIARQRAETAAQVLMASGRRLPAISLGARTSPTTRVEPDARLRRVDFAVIEGADPLSPASRP
jgi:OOP family OmpA-OmpF porin